MSQNELSKVWGKFDVRIVNPSATSQSRKLRKEISSENIYGVESLSV